MASFIFLRTETIPFSGFTSSICGKVNDKNHHTMSKLLLEQVLLADPLPQSEGSRR